MNSKFLLILFSIVCLNACQNRTKKTSTSDISSNQELVESAKDAYIFSYPIVMMYRSMYLQALNPEDGVGMGNWLHLGVSNPEDTTIVTPNNDSPYSYAWLDLRTEPYVLTMPKIEENRFYTSQWDDMFGYVLDNAGSVGDGNEGVRVLLTAPDFNDEIPEGINRVIKGNSNILGTLTRTQLIGAEDLPNVKAIQQKYKLEPLSSYLGNEAPQSAAEIEWMKWEEGAEFKDGFWRFAGFVSQFVTKHSDDKSKWDDLAKFGFEQGGNWDISKLTEDQKSALEIGQKEAVEYLNEMVSKTFDPKKFFNTREDMKHIGDDDQYVQRSMGVLAGIFGNTKDISVYYGFQTDVNGNIPDVSETPYTLTFKKEELPNVKNFWSITMYSLPKRLLVPNDIERYSIGSASTDMKNNPDGSLTIYIQPNAPENDKLGNWLPSPNGPFWIVMRCYGPDQSIIKGTWPEPELAPVN